MILQSWSRDHLWRLFAGGAQIVQGPIRTCKVKGGSLTSSKQSSPGLGSTMPFSLVKAKLLSLCVCLKISSRRKRKNSFHPWWYVLAKHKKQLSTLNPQILSSLTWSSVGNYCLQSIEPWIVSAFRPIWIFVSFSELYIPENQDFHCKCRSTQAQIVCP